MRYRLMSLSANNIYASTCRFVGMANSGFILIKNTTEFCCLPRSGSDSVYLFNFIHRFRETWFYGKTGFIHIKKTA